MNWKTTLFLLLVAVGLVVYVVVNDLIRPPAPPLVPLFTGVRADQVTEAVVKVEGRTLHLEKSDPTDPEEHRPASQAWIMTEPFPYDVSKEQVETLLNEFLSITKGRREYRIKGGDPSQYGLEPAKGSIRVVGPNFDKTLLLGDLAPYEGLVFAQLEGDDEIFTVPESLTKEAAKDVNEYRDKRPMDFDPSRITKIRAVYWNEEENAVEITRQGDGKWRITAPVSCSAGQEEVNSFLSKIREVGISSFVNDDPSQEELDRLGFTDARPSRPSIKVTLSLGENKEPLTFRFGEKRPSESQYERGEFHYFKRDDQPYVYLVQIVRGEDYIKRVADLRDDRVVVFEDKELHRMTLEHRDGKKLILLRTGEEWEFEHPAGLPTKNTDKGRVDLLLNRMRGLRFKERARTYKAKNPEFQPLIENGRPVREKYGLAPPNVRITLEEHTGKTRILSVGDVDGEHLPVWLESEDPILFVDASFSEPARWGYLDFRTRRMTDIWAEGGYELTIDRETPSGGRETLTFVKGDRGRWLLQGADEPLDRPAARDLVNRLAHLDVERFEAYGKKVNWRPFGLDQKKNATLTATVKFRSEKRDQPDRTVTLWVKKDRVGTFHARLLEDRDNHLFTLPLPLTERLFGDLTAGARSMKEKLKEEIEQANESKEE